MYPGAQCQLENKHFTCFCKHNWSFRTDHLRNPVRQKIWAWAVPEKVLRCLLTRTSSSDFMIFLILASGS
jgi:hypothetical protein